MAEPEKTEYTACLIVIGNEILSGRTRDANLQYLAEKLNSWGIQMREARVIPDVEQTIIDAVHECRQAYDYVFTTGGIGPTHDDITAATIAKAFGRKLVLDQATYDRMASHYFANNMGDFNKARQKMCYVPEGSELIGNSISIAPGFQVENVYVLAGVPSIMRAMVDTLQNRLVGGKPVQSRSLNLFLGEGAVAEGLTNLQNAYPEVDMGSYPFYRDGRFGTSLVLRAADENKLDSAAGELAALANDLNAEWHWAAEEGEP